MSSTSQRLANYLHKIENRAIGGTARRRYWFVADHESPFVYWFRNEDDILCLGRAPLSGAAFTFDPLVHGRFEIHVNGETHTIECADDQQRERWLQHLQSIRREHYDFPHDFNFFAETGASTARDAPTAPEPSRSTTALDNSCFYTSSSSSSAASPEPLAADGSRPASQIMIETKFYVDTDGGLLPMSLEMPSPPSRDLIHAAEHLLTRIADETQAKTVPAKRALFNARQSFRLPSFHVPGGNHRNGKTCENCTKLTEMVQELKDRCFALTDEVAANQDLVCTLRNAVVTAYNQRDALKKTAEASEQEKLDFMLERESLLTEMQVSNATLKRQVQQMEEKVAKLTSENEAFMTSIKTKDELIMRIYDENHARPVSVQLPQSSTSSSPPLDIGIPEGIAVDAGDLGGFPEATVVDVEQLRDLVGGYQSQNKFFSNEVLQLQQIVQALESRERKLIRQNYDVEACFYQLKSRYMMVLNHFRRGFDEAKKQLQPELVEELIVDVNKPFSFMHRVDSLSPRKPSLSIVLNTPHENSLTDALGFYLHAKRPLLVGSGAQDGEEKPKTGDDIVDKATELKSLSDKIVKNIQIEQSRFYLDWLQKWDSFLVNYSSATQLTSNAELKNLVRQGIPHTYRGRVWRNLVKLHVNAALAETGRGYYSCLLRRSENVTDPSNDQALRQIDLDLLRTLPTNAQFNDPSSEKMAQLKRVLYAFRFHNKSVEYCQGLNRIAAIGLLYLPEDEAFWFLVAVVEHLQPPDYYTASLSGAIADQKVLLDLVQEKVPKVFNHLKTLNVDLTLFTLSWFLTVFVDALSHDLYLTIFDSFLLEGNKVIFRFAIALLRTCESTLLSCNSIGAVHSCLSNLMALQVEAKDLAKSAFVGIQSFPLKAIETKRALYIQQAEAARRK